MLPGDDDGTVTVATTRLKGAVDFRVVPVRHTFIMNDPNVQKMAASFLNTGSLEKPAERQPIRSDAE